MMIFSFSARIAKTNIGDCPLLIYFKALYSFLTREFGSLQGLHRTKVFSSHLEVSSITYGKWWVRQNLDTRNRLSI
jgi:hypothetical protein